MSDTGEEKTPPPDLIESMRQVGASGRASVGAAVDIAKALRKLVAADVSLARSAMGRTMVVGGLAGAFGVTSWLLVTSAIVLFLHGQIGFSWVLSLLLPALVNLVLAGIAGWIAMKYFEHTRLKATRRQLARLGIGELADFMPDAASSQSTRDATRSHPAEDGNGRPMKDEQGIDVTPP
ncbi:MAG: phage holin family protein [Lysobacter spongiicola]|nr:phage holin family protein [Lysobacter spongiicola]